MFFFLGGGKGVYGLRGLGFFCCCVCVLFFVFFFAGGGFRVWGV